MAAFEVTKWVAGWSKAALLDQLAYTGEESTQSPITVAAAQPFYIDVTELSQLLSTSTMATDYTWAQTQLGIAQAAHVTANTAQRAAEGKWESAKRWREVTGEESAKADADLTRARALLADLTEEIAPLARAEAVAQVNYDAAVAAQAIRTAATAELGDAAGVDPVANPATGARAVAYAAAKTKDSVDAQQAFHDARLSWAEDQLTPVAEEKAALALKKADVDGMVTMAEAVLLAAKDQCKKAAFLQAQRDRVTAKDLAEARTEKITEVRRAYEDRSAFPADGSVGTLCNIPKPVEGEAPGARAECAEGEPGAPLCCGAAQRFLKDGTKLSIETCQLATATTYTYYPALPDDALVAPSVETWRFQCISAAQKLAAAATAALAAGYMMA
jgi:hypothetical protein